MKRENLVRSGFVAGVLGLLLSAAAVLLLQRPAWATIACEVPGYDCTNGACPGGIDVSFTGGTPKDGCKKNWIFAGCTGSCHYCAGGSVVTQVCVSAKAGKCAVNRNDFVACGAKTSFGCAGTGGPSKCCAAAAKGGVAAGTCSVSRCST